MKRLKGPTEQICSDFMAVHDDDGLTCHVKGKDGPYCASSALGVYNECWVQDLPYCFAHSENWNQGMFEGVLKTFPRKGNPGGPGGILCLFVEVAIADLRDQASRTTTRAIDTRTLKKEVPGKLLWSASRYGIARVLNRNLAGQERKKCSTVLRSTTQERRKEGVCFN